MSTGFENPGLREVLSAPERLGSYVDLFCGMAKPEAAGETGRGILQSGAACMLALDGPALAILINRYSELRKSLRLDLAEHLRPLVDAVLREQLARGVVPTETPGQFLLRSDDPATALTVAERYLGRVAQGLGEEAWSRDRRPAWTWTPARRLRIGYVCSDLTIHPVGLSIRSLMGHHDKNRFEVFLYDRTPVPDMAVAGPVTAAADVKRACVDLSAAGLARLVRDDGIDILVDLSGAVIGGGDTVFARPAAPVRVSMIGYPGAMSRGITDYAVVDATTVPPEVRAGFSERLIFMPGSFLPLDDTFAVGAAPSRRETGLPEDAFVMASFNRLDKVTLETVRLWIACLGRIPRAVLWLASDDGEAVAAAGGLLERAGLDRGQLVVSRRVSVPDHARRHQLADVCLDPLGYNGGHTTALSLWCGVSVVSRPGRCFAWRMSAGLLRTAGLDECVTGTAAEYLAQVRRIAEDPAHAEDLRSRLTRDRLSRCLG